MVESSSQLILNEGCKSCLKTAIDKIMDNIYLILFTPNKYVKLIDDLTNMKEIIVAFGSKKDELTNT